MTVQSSLQNLPSRAPIAILGVPIDYVTTPEALNIIDGMIASRQPHYVVTVNVDFLVQAQSDVELRRILVNADLALCDGTPVLWASRLLGNALPERVAGSDLVPLLLEAAEQRGYRLFFLGASQQSAQAAVRRLRAEHPALQVVGQYSPPYAPLLDMDHDEISRRIREAKPDVLFVCFGCPKQEKWMSMHCRQLGVPVAIGLGGTIDFLAGHLKRAPVWMRRTGTEWVFRLVQEPRRLFKRYVKDLWVFGGALGRQCWGMGKRSLNPKAPTRENRPANNQSNIASPISVARMPSRLDAAAVRDLSNLCVTIQNDTRPCLLDLSAVEFMDSTGVGLLIRLQKNLRAQGRRMILAAPGEHVRRAIALMKLQLFFECAPTTAEGERRLAAPCEPPSVAEKPRAGQACVAWQGEVTAANAPAVRAQTERAFIEGGRSDWVLDLADTPFIDSTGLGIMVRLRKLALEHGASLNIENVSPTVRNVIRIARLEQLLLVPKPAVPLEPTLRTALKPVCPS